MQAIQFLLNQTPVAETMASATPLLDVIRHSHRLMGCKEACREGDCGACLVLLGKLEQGRLLYRPATACLVPLGAVSGRHVVTIEGLNSAEPNPIQHALVEQGGIQCGFCTPGIVMALTAFFLTNTTSDVDAAVDAVAGNLCRCGGYAGIKRAIRQLCSRFDLSQSPPEHRLADCIAWKLLPPDFAERLKSLSETNAAESNEPAIVIAGGTDLMVHRAEAFASECLRFLPIADERQAVRLEGTQCKIAATASVEQLRTSAVLQNCLPGIAEDLKLLCSAPVRQHATLGGNLANASPIADLAVMLLALDAVLLLDKDGQRRSLRLGDFFIGYKQTALLPGERLLEVGFNCSEATTGFSFEKVSKRQFLDIASVNSALSMRLANGVIDSVHLAAGGVAQIPMYLATTCDYLRGKPLRPEIVLQASNIAQTEISPISDLRGSVEYKRLLFRQLLFAHFLKLCPEQISWEALNAAA